MRLALLLLSSALPVLAQPAKPVLKPDGTPVTLKDLRPRSYLEVLQEQAAQQKRFDEMVKSLDALYDGAAPREKEPVNVSQHVEIENGEIRRATIKHHPSRMQLEFGTLGRKAGRSDLVDTSPYLNLRADWSSRPHNWVDTQFQWQAALVWMKARYFADEFGTDPGTDALLDRMAEAALRAGVPPEEVAKVRGLGSYDSPWRTTTIAVGSAWASMGRAYSLFGPLDAAWSVGMLGEASHLLPTASGDASAGPRLRLGEKTQIQAHGGMTWSASPLGADVLQSVLRDRPKWGLHVDKAPHAGIKYRGPIPGEEGMFLDLSAFRQWNRYTEANILRGALSMDVAGRPTELGATFIRESGPQVEFDRNKRVLDVTRKFSDQVSASVGVFQDDFRFGSARVTNEAVAVGLKIDLDDGDTARIEHRFTEKDKVVNDPSQGFSRPVKEFHRSLGQVLSIAESAQRLSRQPVSPHAGDAGKNPERLEFLAGAIDSLDPLQREALKQAMLAEARNQEERDAVETAFRPENLANLSTNMRGTAEVLRLLGDGSVLERFAVRVARNRLIDYLDKVDLPLPVLDYRFRWTPATLMAAAYGLNRRHSPMLPLSAADEKGVIEPWIWKQLGRAVHLGPEATPEQIARELVKRAPPQVQAEFEAGGEAALKAFAEALAGMIRREVDQLVINMILAAEQFDELTVHQGRKAGEMNADALDAYYRNLDVRKGRISDVMAGAVRRLEGQR